MKKNRIGLFMAATAVCMLFASGVSKTEEPQVVAMAAWNQGPTPVPTPVVQKKKEVKYAIANPGDSVQTIQELLDLNKYGKYDELILVLQPGEYNLHSTLYVYSNTTIYADGAKINKSRSYGAVIEGGILNDDGGYDGCENITIHGGHWDAEAMLYQKRGTETFRFIHASNITIRNVELSNIPEGGHFIVLAGVKDALVENCVFHGYGDNGDSVRDAKEAVQLDVVHNLEIVPTDQNIRWDDLPCKNITIKNCRFYDFSRAIGSHSAVAGVYHEGITIQNNVIQNMEEVAIKLYQYKDSVISGNTISNCATGILVYTEYGDSRQDAYFMPLNGRLRSNPDNLNIVIEKNVISDITVDGETYGDAIRISATDNLPMSGITVRNNKIKTTARYGIFATATSNLVLEGNSIEDTEGYGIILEKNSRNAELKLNTIKRTGSCGIWIATGSTGATISKNKVSDYAQKEEMKYGIAVFEAGSKENKTLIEGNEVTGPGKATNQNGIHLNSSDYVEVVDNVVYNVAGCGIYVYQSKHCTVKWNDVIGTTRYGIYATTRCNGTIIENNRVSSTADTPIMIYQAQGSMVTGNEVYSLPILAGIRISQSNSSVITGNRINSAYKGREVWLTNSFYCTNNDNDIR